MPQADIWFRGNDMIVRLSALRSSTMASGTFLQNSTGVTVDIWGADTTASTGNKLITGTNVPYSTAAGSSGRYEVVIQSTAHSLASGTVGFADITVRHSGMDGNWRPRFYVEHRRTT